MYYEWSPPFSHLGRVHKSLWRWNEGWPAHARPRVAGPASGPGGRSSGGGGSQLPRPSPPGSATPPPRPPPPRLTRRQTSGYLSTTYSTPHEKIKSLQNKRFFFQLHRKKRLGTFPSPAGMSPTKLSRGGNSLIIPSNGEFGKWLGTGMSPTFFTSVALIHP